PWKFLIIKTGDNMMNNNAIKSYPIIFITTVVIGLSFLLLWIRENQPFSLEIFEREQYNQQISYQVTVLLLMFIVIGLINWITGKKGFAYLNLKKMDGKIQPEPWIGIKPKESETWKNLGLNFAIVITLITAVVIYFQVVKNGSISVDMYPG